MKNPVQQMLKAGSRMKNNPPLAQKEAQSPNKINSFAAQMVIPEQQAMQRSKPIPYPVGSVLMQKLAQAQQAALASHMPQPSEGGIAQAAAKGGKLKYVGGGYTGSMKDVKEAQRKARAAYQAQPTRKEQIAKATEVTPTKLGDLPGMEEFQTEAKTGIAKGLEAQQKATAAANRAKTKSQKVSAAKTAKMAANFDKAVENMGPKPKPKPKPVKKPKTVKPVNTAEQLIAELGSPYEEAKAQRLVREGHDAAAEQRAGEATTRAKVRDLVAQGETPSTRVTRGQRKIGRAASPDYRTLGIEQAVSATNVPGPKKVAEGLAAESKEARKIRRDASAEALKTREGKPAPKPAPSRWTPNEGSRNDGKVTPSEVSTSILKGSKEYGVRKKASDIGPNGKVTPKVAATPEQKARRERLAKELNLPEKTGIAKAASPEARAYLAEERPIITPASPAEPAAPTTRQKTKPLTRAEKTGKRSPAAGLPTTGGPEPAVSGVAKPAAPAADTTLPSKKKTPDVTQEEATSRLKKAKDEGLRTRGETPATLHAKVEGITEGAIHSDPEVHAEVSKLATDFKSQNPDATVEQMGAHIMDNASEATRSKFIAKAGPLLQKYGVRLGKAAGAIGAYESAANIGNVAIDPTKSKADVAKAVGHEAVGAVPAVAGAGIGAGMGALTGPAAPVAVPVLGLAGGIAGAVGGDPAVRWMKEKLGMDQEGPQATARHTIPTVGDVASTVADQFSGDSWNKSPEQRAKDEIAAMPEDEETLRLERMGRGEMSLPEIARGAPPAAESKSVPPAQGPAARPTVAPSSRGAAPAGQAPAAQQQPGGGGITTAPQAPKVPGAGAQTDQYAGDTSEATPEGAVQELMKLRGPSYAYSPEVMGMLKDARDEDRAATALSMFAGMGAGLANRDRYQGAHDAALLANQAFTSGREREGQAEQRFLQGIIHNEQIPYEQRQAAYETYVKMQMASAQNEALMARANLAGGYKLDAANIMANARALAGQGSGLETERKGLNDLLDSLTLLRNKAAEQAQDTSIYDRRIEETMAKLRGLVGIAGDAGLGQTRPQPTTLDVR